MNKTTILVISTHVRFTSAMPILLLGLVFACYGPSAFYLAVVEQNSAANVAENFRHCVPRGGFWSSLGALQHRQKQQGRTTTATCYVASVSQAREVEAVEGFYVEV